MSQKSPERLTHVGPDGQARMVDVGAKPVTAREAVARGRVRMSAEARRLVRAGAVRKGDPIQTARLAGIMGAKATATLIPLCHPLPLAAIDVAVGELGPLGQLELGRGRRAALLGRHLQGDGRAARGDGGDDAGKHDLLDGEFHPGGGVRAALLEPDVGDLTHGRAGQVLRHARRRRGRLHPAAAGRGSGRRVTVGRLAAARRAAATRGSHPVAHGTL